MIFDHISGLYIQLESSQTNLRRLAPFQVDPQPVFNAVFLIMDLCKHLIGFLLNFPLLVLELDTAPWRGKRGRARMNLYTLFR